MWTDSRSACVFLGLRECSVAGNGFCRRATAASGATWCWYLPRWAQRRTCSENGCSDKNEGFLEVIYLARWDTTPSAELHSVRLGVVVVFRHRLQIDTSSLISEVSQLMSAGVLLQYGAFASPTDLSLFLSPRRLLALPLLSNHPDGPALGLSCCPSSGPVGPTPTRCRTLLPYTRCKNWGGWCERLVKAVKYISKGQEYSSLYRNIFEMVI